ncbi:Ig-like domain-containing protein [Pseudomonas sp. McL0111]|uniref:Ig-like domain-containing protein n=1 Tax=Pseudomonas sp. McL0111 TaxID=3457357 RepID=UPI00403E4AC5
MTTATYKVAIADGKTMTDVQELSTSGQPVRIKAVANGKYVLAEGDKGIAPANVTVKRVGKDLHVTLEGGNPDQPQLIIEGFYDAQGQLVGMAEDGSFHEYVAADAVQDHSSAFLIEGVPAPQVLGVESVSSMSGMSGMSGVGGLAGGVFGTGIGLLGAGLIGLAAVGLAGAAVAAGNDDDKKHDDAPATTPPPAPVVGDNAGTDSGSLVNGGITDDTTPTFSGEGTPGNTIIIKDGDKVIGETIIGEDGKWTFTPEPLDGGSHEIVFVERNRDGIEGPPSPGFEFIIDVQAPAQSVINSVQDDAGVPGPIAQNGRTNDTTPTLSGQAEPGSRVEIFANGEKIGEAPVGADGTWSFTPSPLDDDSYSFTVVAVDAAGNRGLPSDPFVFTIDTNVPGTPGENGAGGIGQVIDDAGNEIPAGSSTNDTTPTFTGSGQTPGSTVKLRDNGVVIGEAIVDENGNWSVTPDEPLSNENHEIDMTITDPIGNESLPSEPYVIVVDTIAPGTPGQDGNGGIDTVRNDLNPATIDIGNGESTNDTTPTIVGSNQKPGDKVTIYNGSDIIGTAIVQADGTWSITPAMALTADTYSFTMTVTDLAGNVSPPSLPYVVTIDTTIPGTPGEGGNPAIGQVVNDDGDVIPAGTSTNDTTPTFSGSGQTPGETVTLYDGIEVIGSVVVADDGSWAITPDTPLSNADHDVTMTVTDPAGNESAKSDPFVITVDTIVPATPGEGGIGGFDVVNDNGSAHTPIGNGDSTNDNTPLFSGSDQQPDDIIKLYRNGAIAGSAIVQADGTWSFTPDPLLTDGTYSFTMTVTDQAGNESAHSDPYVFTVDIVAPVKPGDDGTGGIDQVIDNVNPGGVEEDLVSGDSTNDSTPTLKGGSQLPGATITIRNGIEIIGTAVVDDMGNWEIIPLTPLQDATYNLTMTVTDEAGNESVESDPFVVTVDTVATGITIDSMGKDGGSSSTDFITNDGSAGRLIQGTTSQALVAGEKVQVSLDNGVTWVDALVNGDTWSYLDTGAHSSDWTVQARVTDIAGNIGTANQDIQLDTAAPTAPSSFVFNGPVVTVNFDGTGLNVGSTVEVVVGNERFAVQLTQAQIDAGSVDVTTNANAAMTTTQAMIVDTAGNVSQYLVPGVSVVDFESVPVQRVAANGEVDFGAFVLNWGGAVIGTKPVGVLAQGTDYWGYITPSRGIGVILDDGVANPRITLATGTEASAMSFRAGHNSDPITVRFYDSSNNLVHSIAMTQGLQEVNFQLPDGKTFTSVEFDGTASDWLWLDDFQFSNGTYEHVDAPADQQIAGTGGYYGDDAANNFSLDTTAFLNNVNSVISGGASNDTLALTGAGQVLDLTNIAGKLESVEIIDITGTGNNTLTLSLEDVLEQGQTSLFTNDDTVQMMIKGNTGDTVNLNDQLSGIDAPGDWAASGAVEVSGVTYNVFKHDSLDAQLLVQDGVTTNLV